MNRLAVELEDGLYILNLDTLEFVGKPQKEEFHVTPAPRWTIDLGDQVLWFNNQTQAQEVYHKIREALEVK